MRTLLVVFAALLTLLALAPIGNGQSTKITGNGTGGGVPSGTATASPTPPDLVLPIAFWATCCGGGSGGSQGADPGATVDQCCVWGFLTNQNANDRSGATMTNCPGRSVGGNACQMYMYVDLWINGCGGYTGAAYTFADSSDENGFVHATSIAPANRKLYQQAAVAPCPTGPPAQNTFMNPGDPTLNTWLVTNEWGSATLFPNAANGVFEDDARLAYTNGSGDGSIVKSIEYGVNGWTWVNTGTMGISLLQGYAYFVNHVPQHMVFNATIGLGSGPCASLVDGSPPNAHCQGNSNFGTGYYDNAIRIDQLCAALTGTNLDGIIGERVINNFTNVYSVSTTINLAANIVNGADPGCDNLKILDLEQPSQDATGGLRQYQKALQWLVPGTSGSPDEFVVWRYGYGGTSNEVPILPEDNIVPVGPEQPVAAYNFNGSTVENGTGCEAAGDTGGAVALVWDCPSTSTPTYGQQYKHCYDVSSGTQVDRGPCAVVVCTNSVPCSLTSAMFPHDPGSTYNFVMTETGSEATSLAGHTISTCSNATYCNGVLNYHGTPLVLPTTIPKQSAYFLTQ